MHTALQLIHSSDSEGIGVYYLGLH